MAASDMRNRRHVQPLLTWSTNAAHPVSLDQKPLQGTISRDLGILGSAWERFRARGGAGALHEDGGVRSSTIGQWLDYREGVSESILDWLVVKNLQQCSWNSVFPIWYLVLIECVVHRKVVNDSLRTDVCLMYPPHQIALVVSEEGLDKLAEMADKIQEMNPRLQVYESKNKDPTFEEMTATIALLKEEIATLKLENRTRQNRRSNSPRPRQRSRSRSGKYNPSGKYCCFHYRFGNKCRPDKCTSPCQWMKPSGKLQRVGEAATDPTAQWTNACCRSRLFVTDAKTGMRFLIDSGADVSLIPFQGNGTPTEDIQLYAANGSLIPTCGFQILDVDLGLRRNFKWRFITARVSKGILGADFLKGHNLLIDLKNRQLIDGCTNLKIRGAVTSMSCGISTLDKNSKFYNILSSFPNITIPNLLRPKVQHNVRHFIATKGPPVFARARPLNSMLLKIAKKEFQYMLDNHINRPSRSPWESPLHMVKKKEGSWRPCGDYRKLNSVTIPDKYPIPKLEDFNHILKNTRYYSKIDLFKAYYQIPINEEDREKTAVITPFGLFEFEVMSFGLCGAPATFQRFINEVLWGLDFVFPYLDDILVASKSEEEHESHLRAVFSRLDQYGLRINQAKTVLNVNNVEFLGYWITPEGIRPTESKVQTIVDYKKPETDIRLVREVTSRYIWLNINKDIRNWTKGCINCQKSKITRHTKTEYGEFGKPDERFGTVHIDLVGPLPPSEGKTYCLTLIDRFTNWVEVLPLEDIKADTIIKSFYKEWISRYGTPCHLITDRGMQFMSQKLKEFAKMWGIQLKHTTSYHPQSNGKIERFHRTLKTAISSHNYIRWTKRLPSVLLGLRSSIYGSSDFSIAQMVFGKTIRLPGEFFQDSQLTRDRDDLIKNLQKDMSSLQPMKSRINRNPNVFIHKDLQGCSHIFIRKDRVKKPLEPAYEGPFKVLKRTVKYFTVMVKGKEDNVSLDRLKPAYLLKESYPEDDDRRQQPGIQQDLQPSKSRTQRVHFEEPQRTKPQSGRVRETAASSLERLLVVVVAPLQAVHFPEFPPFQRGVHCQEMSHWGRPVVVKKPEEESFASHFDDNLPILVTCDSSEYGIGAIFPQVDHGVERPVVFASRTLNKTEIRHAVIDREALAVIFAVTKFYQYLLGRKFKILTDHKPLVGLFNLSKPIPQFLSPCMSRWCLTLSAYSYSIEYKPSEVPSPPE
ncbi:hypothetical protein LAZ67_19002227, partial [Cordylochernes scorpioides]